MEISVNKTAGSIDYHKMFTYVFKEGFVVDKDNNYYYTNRMIIRSRDSGRTDYQINFGSKRIQCANPPFPITKSDKKRLGILIASKGCFVSIVI